jgi:hypothetical protein
MLIAALRLQILVLLQMVRSVILYLVFIDEFDMFFAARLAIDHGICGLSTNNAMKLLQCLRVC